VLENPALQTQLTLDFIKRGPVPQTYDDIEEALAKLQQWELGTKGTWSLGPLRQPYRSHDGRGHRGAAASEWAPLAMLSSGR